MKHPSSTPSGLWDRGTPHDVRSDLFGGVGIVRVWALVAAPALPFAAVLACELEPGASVGPHVQPQFPELVLALSGSGQVEVSGVSSTFCEGTVVELAHGQTLSIRNESTERPLRYLIIKAHRTRL